MKNPVCFSHFSNSAKPNRLIFEEAPPEGQNSLPNVNQAKESTDIQGSHTLSCERVLVLESFRRRMIEGSTAFDGDDFTKTEKAQNEVLQYLYEKLDRFFENQTSTEWPVNRQREWMDIVANYIIGFIEIPGASLYSISSNKAIDEIIPAYITEGHHSGRKWLPGIGTFPVWFSKKYPVEYHKIFGKGVKKD